MTTPLIGRPPVGSQVHVQNDTDLRSALCGARAGHGPWELDQMCPDCWEASRSHVPTPDELDDLLSDISMAGYASEAREIVEVWTRKHWGVESAFTTRWNGVYKP